MKLQYRKLSIVIPILLMLTTAHASGPLLTLKGSWNTAMYRPTRIATSSAGMIAITDYHRKQIYIYDDGYRLLTSITLSTPPLSIAYAEDGSLYTGIQNDILKINSKGEIIDKFSLHGLTIHSPVGLAVDKSGLVYVIDRDDCKVIVCSSTGDKQYSFGTAGTNKGEFFSPTGIAIDEAAREIIVADAGNSRVQIFSTGGQFHRMFGEHIKQVDTTWQLVGTFAQMQGVAVDVQHRIYVTDSGLDHVQIFDANGNHLGFLGKDGLRVSRFRVPMGVTISNTGQLLVASMASSEIKEYIIQSTTDVKPTTPSLPSHFALEQNFPNPFNPTTSIKFSLPENGYVNLTIYDISGREVTKLASKDYKTGSYEIKWDGTNKNGNPVASGIYFYRLQVGEKYSQTNKMIFLK